MTPTKCGEWSCWAISSRRSATVSLPGRWDVGLWLAFLALILAHLGGGINWTASALLLQEVVPDHYRGRVFAIDLGFSSLTQAVSTLLFSVALEIKIAPVWLALTGAAALVNFWSGLGSVDPAYVFATGAGNCLTGLYFLRR